MLPSATAPVMVGRERELDALRRAHRETLDGTPRGAVVAGEAGIGKTRLLRELTAGLGPEVVVARGQCVARGVLAAPLSPVREVLRDLLAHFGAPTLLEAAGQMAGLVPALLPQLAEGDPPELRPEQLYDLLTLLLQELSFRSPLVLLVEDVHWADPPTLDLLREFLHVLRRGRILVVVTCRDDDLVAHEPLGPFLAEAGRARAVRMIELERLDPAQVAEQARSIGSAPAGEPELAQLARRSDGIPFLVEELLSLDGGPALPRTLRELLLARYARLGPVAQEAVRLLAVGGVRVEHDLLALVHDGRPAELESALREAVTARVVVTDDTSYTFRHALTQEAVYADVFPGERVRLHSRYAAVLAQRPARPGRAAEVAHHRVAAGEGAEALGALVEASREAYAGGAPLSAGQLGERALALWPQVRDAREQAGCTRAQLYREVAKAYDSAGDERALGVLEDALATVTAADPAGRALLLHEAMVVRYSHGRSGGVQLCQEALELLPDPQDDYGRFVRARARCGLGIALSFLLDPEGPGLLEEAVGEVRELLDRSEDPQVSELARWELVRALTNLATVRTGRRDVEETLAALAEARALAAPDPDSLLRVDERVLALLLDAGRFARARDVATDAWERAQACGTHRSWGAEMLLFRALATLALGDLGEARKDLDHVLTLRPVGIDRAMVAGAQIQLALSEGDLAGAQARYAASRDLVQEAREGDPGDDIILAFPLGWLRLAGDDLLAAWQEVETLWRHPALPTGLGERAVALGAAVLAAMRRRGVAPVGVPLGEAEDKLRRTLEVEDGAAWAVAQDWRTLVDAELSGPDGTGTDVGAWQVAVAATGHTRVPAYQHAYSLVRLGEVQLAADDRAGAAESLSRARQEAERCGFVGLLREADGLARRGRLSLTGDPEGAAREGGHGAASGLRLTSRERQVLELVAAGLTNRQIGQRLFISDKTASVHVSAILRKLGASTRSEAAGRASEVLPPQPPRGDAREGGGSP